jgi:hypothetical protein
MENPDPSTIKLCQLLNSTATTKRRWLPVDRTVRVSAYRTGRTARPQDLDGGRSQVVVAHPGLEPRELQDLNHGLGHRVQDPAHVQDRGVRKVRKPFGFSSTDT